MQGDTKDMYPPLHRGHDSKDPEDDEKRPFLARGRDEENGAEQPRRLDSDTAASLPVDPNRKFEGFLSLFPNWASIAKPFFCERGIRAKAWCLSISTVILTLFQVSVFVGFSYASRNFNTALQKKDNESFYRSIAVFLGLILIACPLFTLGRYIEGYVSLTWREFLTERFLGSYFKNKSYYHLKRFVEIDNPDQRITDDVNEYVDNSVKIITLIVKAVAYIISFTGVLYSISAILVVFLLVYSTVGVVIAVYCFGRKLMELQRTALEREATFRFSLVRVRENAESVAFYNGGERESRGSTGLFGSLLTTLYSQLKWLAGLQYFNSNFQYITFVLPSLIIAPAYFEGKVEFGVIPQASMAFSTIRGNLALLANNLATFAALGATAARLTSLRDALGEPPVPPGEVVVRKELILDGEDDGNDGNGESKAAAAQKAASKKSEGVSSVEMQPIAEDKDAAAEAGEAAARIALNPAGHSLRVERLILKTPDGSRLLVKDLSLALKPGNALLIVGPSGCGKSSLLRCFAGLWGRGAGEIAMLGKPPNLGISPQDDDDRQRSEEESKQEDSSNSEEGGLEKADSRSMKPSSTTIAFVPQKPYMALFGTLKEQLMFPTPLKAARKANPLGSDPLGPSRHASTELTAKLNKYGEYQAVTVDQDDTPGVPSAKRFRKALDEAALGSLMSRFTLNDKIAWEDVLSLGQQQRLTLARLFLREKVSLAFLDEATSACDSRTEQIVYSAVKEHVPTFISIAHRVRSLLKFHTHVLQCEVVNDSNKWTFMTAQQYRNLNESKTNDDA